MLNYDYGYYTEEQEVSSKHIYYLEKLYVLYTKPMTYAILFVLCLTCLLIKSPVFYEIITNLGTVFMSIISLVFQIGLVILIILFIVWVDSVSPNTENYIPVYRDRLSDILKRDIEYQERQIKEAKYQNDLELSREKFRKSQEPPKYRVDFLTYNHGCTITEIVQARNTMEVRARYNSDSRVRSLLRISCAY